MGGTVNSTRGWSVGVVSSVFRLSGAARALALALSPAIVAANVVGAPLHATAFSLASAPPAASLLGCCPVTYTLPLVWALARCVGSPFAACTTRVDVVTAAAPADAR